MTASEIADIRKQYDDLIDKSKKGKGWGDYIGRLYNDHFGDLLSTLERLTAPVTIKEATRLHWDFDSDTCEDPYEADQHAMQKFLDNRLAAEQP